MSVIKSEKCPPLSLFLKESKGWAAAAAAAATDGCSHLKMKNLLFTAAF